MNHGGSDGPRKVASRTSTVHRSAWEDTVADVAAIASDLRDAGLDVLTVQAGDTAALTPGEGDDRFGLSHVIPDNEADAVADAVAAMDAPTSRVFRQEVGGYVFVVTQLADGDAGRAILLAGVYEKQYEAGLVRAASDAGEMYTHVRTLDGTHLGSFRHDDWRLFFPDADEA